MREYTTKDKLIDLSDVRTELFSEAAAYFKKHGEYPNDRDWWLQERKRLVEGYTVDGFTITGEHYGYLNFCRIKLTADEDKNKQKKILYRKAITKEYTFPDFWDGDYVFYWLKKIARHGASDYPEVVKDGGISLEQFEKLRFPDSVRIKADTFEHEGKTYTLYGSGKNLVLAKKRRWGASYKLGYSGSYRYNLYPKSTTLYTAYDMAYLTDDAIMSKCKENLDFVDKHTKFGRRRLINVDDHVKSGWKEKTDTGVEVEQGYLSQIIAVSFRANKAVARGKDADEIYVEECFAKGTKIIMFDGSLKNVEDVNIGDFVLGVDSKPKRVKETHKGIDDMYLVEQARGINYVTNSNHILVLEQKANHASYPNDGLKSIRTKDFNNLPPYLQRTTHGLRNATELDFGFKEVEIEPYYLGLWLGDGSKDRPEITLHKDEVEIDTYIKEYASRLGLKTKERWRRETTKQVLIYEKDNITNKFKDIFKKYNLHFNKHIPSDYLFNDVNSRYDLLAGLLDSDGYLARSSSMKENKTQSYEITQKNKQLAENIVYLSRSLGFHATLTEKIAKSQVGTQVLVYRINIKGEVWKIPCRAPRKKAINLNKNLQSYHTPIKVTKIGKGEYFGFELEAEKPSDKLFFLEDFTVVHNSGKAPNLLDFTDATMDTLGDGIYASGQIIWFGTGGGDNTDWDGFKEIFFNPAKYKCLEFENVWDEGAAGTYCGMFVPDYWNNVGFITEKGESLIGLAKEYEEEYQRTEFIEKNDAKGLIARKMEHPFCPADAFAISSSNIFDTISIREWRKYVEINKLHKAVGNVGELVRDADGKLKFELNENLPTFWDYPVKRGAEAESAIVMWHPPAKDPATGRPHKNLYVVDVDSYRYDSTATGVSVGAVYVYCRPSNVVSAGMDDRLVAQFIGRPKKGKDHFSKIVFELAEYYNAKIGFENDDMTLVDYAKRFKLLHYLESEFELAYDERIKTANSGVRRGFGMHIGSGKLDERKLTGDEYIKDWLETRRSVDSEGNVKLNLHTIYDIGLLKELEEYNPTQGNFDRVAAFRIQRYHARELVYKRLEARKEQKVSRILTHRFFK